MSDSTSVLKATDEQIRAFETDHEGRKRFVNSGVMSLGPETLYLNQCAGSVDWMIACATHGSHPATFALGRGDVKYEDLEDDTRAIFSDTVKQCAAGLREIAEKVLSDHIPEGKREIYERIRDKTATSWAGAHDIDEAIVYFGRLCDFVAEAAEEGMGLIKVVYEDW